MIGPAAVLAVIVGVFHVSAYVFIRGRAGARVPLLIVAAVLGAWAGDALGARLAIDPIRIGEFNLLSASVVAWLGIGLVAIVSVLVPERRERIPERRVTTTLTHAHATEDRLAPDAPPPAPSTDPKPRGDAMIDRIARTVRDLLGGVSFHRGLALGALVGAAIAGSTLWSRIREARRR